MEEQIKFHFGKRKHSIFDWVKVGVVLNLSIDLLSRTPWWSRKQVFNFIDKNQLQLHHDLLNEYIIKDREFLSFRLERELNKAIKDYEYHYDIDEWTD